tara:strand:+ start:435 stop:980 length:546 start_codon:yes stop_codon:yes gene_type:complete
MVKNKFGGNRHKKMASKDAKVVHTRKTRFVKEEGEMYAKVSKLYGGGHALIECSDNVERTLVIRQKFKKRNKRDNSITLGCYVLIGIREWEVVAPSKKQKADLLYVYGKNEINDIIASNKNLGTLFQSVIDDKEDVNVEFDVNATNNFNAKANVLSKKVSVEKKKEEEEDNTKVDFDWDEI